MQAERCETRAESRDEAKKFRKQLKELVNEGKIEKVKIKKIRNKSEWLMSWAWTR